MAKKKSAPPKLTGHRQNFVKLIEELSYRHSRYTAFSDFNELFAIDISNSLRANSAATLEARAKKYQETLAKYNDREREIFPKLAAEVVLEMENDFPNYRDVLGELFHAMNLQNEANGQFFTPQNISDMMSKMTVDAGQLAPIIKERGFVTIQEPCAGGGSTLLGVINAFFEQGLNPCKEAVFFANDIDERCVHMAYIQLSLAGVPAVVNHIDTLLNEPFGEPWFTPVYVAGFWNYRLRRAFKGAEGEDTTLPATAEETPSLAEKPAEKLGQLTLF